MLKYILDILTNDDNSSYNNIKKELEKCKESKKKYKKLAKSYQQQLCENFVVPINNKFYIKDSRGKVDLYEVYDGYFVNATFCPLPCPYGENNEKKNYWNVIFNTVDGCKTLVAGTADSTMDNNLIRNPPYAGDCVTFKFKTIGKGKMKLSFRYKIIKSGETRNGSFIVCKDDEIVLEKSECDQVESDGWTLFYVDNIECYNIIKFSYKRSNNIENDEDEVVMVKNICLYNGYIKSCDNNDDNYLNDFNKEDHKNSKNSKNSINKKDWHSVISENHEDFLSENTLEECDDNDDNNDDNFDANKEEDWDNSQEWLNSECWSDDECPNLDKIEEWADTSVDCSNLIPQ